MPAASTATPRLVEVRRGGGAAVARSGDRADRTAPDLQGGSRGRNAPDRGGSGGRGRTHAARRDQREGEQESGASDRRRDHRATLRSPIGRATDLSRPKSQCLYMTSAVAAVSFARACSRPDEHALLPSQDDQRLI